MEPKKRKSFYRATPISTGALEQLSKRYNVGVDELRMMATELNLGRPKLEMHLLYLKLVNKSKTGNLSRAS